MEEGVEAGKAGELLFLWYEDMKADLGAAVRRVAAYLGQAITEEQAGSTFFIMSLLSLFSHH